MHARRYNVETGSDSEHWQANLARIQVSKHWSPALRPHISGNWELITRRGIFFIILHLTLLCFLALLVKVPTALPFLLPFLDFRGSDVWKGFGEFCKLLPAMPKQTWTYSFLRLSHHCWHSVGDLPAMKFLLGFSDHFCTSTVLQLNELWMPRGKTTPCIAFPWLVALQSCLNTKRQRNRAGRKGQKERAVHMCIWEQGNCKLRWS